MAARYSRLPTEDSESVAFDFGSAFTFSSASPRTDDYKSIFSYSRHSHMQSEDVRLAVVKQSFISRLCSHVVVGVCFVLCILTFPVSFWFCFKTATEFEKILVFRLGRMQKVKQSGIVFVIPVIDRWKKVDVRMKAFNVPPLQLLTRDAGIVEMGADVYYQITDVVKSVTMVQDLNISLRTLVRNILTNHVVRYELSDIEAKSRDIVAYIQAECNKTTGDWGVSICRLEFSPIKVLQAPQGGENGLPSGLGGDALQQMFQQLAMAFTGQGGPQFMPQASPVTSKAEAAGAAVSPSDISVLPGLTPSDILALVKGVLTETLVRSVGCTFQFNLTGPNGGTFYMDLKHGCGRVGEGPEPSGDPDVTLGLSVEDMQMMIIGQLNPLQSYMSGRLKVSGDLSAALKLEEVMEKVVQKMNNPAMAASQHAIINI